MIRPNTSPFTRASILRCLIASAALFPSAAFAATDGAAKQHEARPQNSHGWTAIIDGKDVAAPETYMGDEVIVRAILDEGKNRNQVMDHLTYLSKDIGHRLTGSTAVERANHWCRENYEKWGLSNPHIEQFGTIATRFDRGPSSANVLLRKETKKDDDSVVVEYESQRNCELTTMAWAAGTNGPLRGHIVKVPKDDEQYAAVKDELKGAWILMEAPPPVGQRGIRGRAGAQYDARKDARRKVAQGIDPKTLSIVERLALEDVAGYITTSRDERVWTGAIPGWRELDADNIPPDVNVQVRLSDYDFINSRIADGEPYAFEANLQHTFTKGPIPVYNTIAEIRGTDFPDEVIIISAHLDSWDGPGSEGCTDNGTGTAVTLEAARILAAVGAKPRRTIRFINWTGEEQGLLGSKAWIDLHKDELPKISAVFVDDGGTNYESGVGCIDTMVDLMAAATAPTNYAFQTQADGWLNVNVRKTGKKIPGGGGSDHASFNAQGVPGFFWAEDKGTANYSHGWHTQHDTLDLAVPEYLLQSSTNAAIVAYRLACAPTMLPREIKEEEKQPEPAKTSP